MEKPHGVPEGGGAESHGPIATGGKRGGWGRGIGTHVHVDNRVHPKADALCVIIELVDEKVGVGVGGGSDTLPCLIVARRVADAQLAVRSGEHAPAAVDPAKQGTSRRVLQLVTEACGFRAVGVDQHAQEERPASYWQIQRPGATSPSRSREGSGA